MQNKKLIIIIIIIKLTRKGKKKTSNGRGWIIGYGHKIWAREEISVW